MNRRQIMLASTMAALAPDSQAAPAAAEGATLELWPGGAPGADKVTVHEEIVERLPDGPMRDRFAQHVTRPLLTLYAPRIAYNGITLLIVPVQALLIAFSMQAFSQDWNVEVERRSDGSTTPAPAAG